MEHKSLSTATTTKANIRMVDSVEKENMCGLILQAFKATLLMVVGMVRELGDRVLKMEMCISVNT